MLRASSTSRKIFFKSAFSLARIVVLVTPLSNLFVGFRAAELRAKVVPTLWE